jgi:D-glycero-alpha-D-manno-heptose 1-phosphate guanylyltransferase
MRSSGNNDVSDVNEAIILAGGLGTRLRSVLSDLPKPMAPVAGRPFLCYLLEFLETQGIRRVVLSVGYRHEAISSFFGRRYGALLVDYAVEEEALGTGGGIAHALQFVEQPYVFVLNGDTFLRMDYRAMATLIENPGRLELAVALRTVSDARRYGCAVLSGNRIQGFLAAGVEGPGLINAGVYLMGRDLFQCYQLPAKFSFETDFLEPRVAEIRPVAFVSDAPFIDIGVPESFEESQTLLPAWTTR